MHEPPPPTNNADEHGVPRETEDFQDGPEDYEREDDYPVVTDEEDVPDQPEAPRLGYLAYHAASGDQEERELEETDIAGPEAQPDLSASATGGGRRDDDPPQEATTTEADEPDPQNENQQDEGRQQEEKRGSIAPPVIVYTESISDEHMKHVTEDLNLDDPVGSLVGDALSSYTPPPGEKAPEELSDQEFDELAAKTREEVLRRLEFAEHLGYLAWRMEGDIEKDEEAFGGEIAVTMDGLDEEGEPVAGHNIAPDEPNAQELIFSAEAKHPFKRDEEGTPFDDLLQQIRESEAATAKGTIETTSGRTLYCKIDVEPSIASGAIMIEVRDTPMSEDFHVVMRATIIPDEGSIEFGMRAHDKVTGERHPDMKSTDLLNFARSAFHYAASLGIDIQYINEQWAKGGSVVYEQYARALPHTSGDQRAAVRETVSAKVYQRWGFEVEEIEDHPKSAIVRVRFKKTRN